MNSKTNTPYLLLYCRAGFENDCAAEIQSLANQLGVSGYSKAQPDHAYVRFYSTPAEAVERLIQEIYFKQLVFARQWFLVREHVLLDDNDNRLERLLKSINFLNVKYVNLLWETPDSTHLQALPRLVNSLKKANLRESLIAPNDETADNQLHLAFLDFNLCCIGTSPCHNASAYAGGVRRLKLPKSAPSRSMLKLDEAIVTFLPLEQRHQLLKAHMQAVDLGAAPGGWSYALSRYGLQVTAVDNGPLAKSVLETNQVVHVRGDAFTFEPPFNVNWLVADIADKPLRVLALVERWIEHGWADHYIFILKLPMQKRQRFMADSVWPILNKIKTQHSQFCLWVKHLAYNRQEITIALI